MNYVLLIANAPDAWDDTDTRPPDGTDDGVISDWGVYTRALESAGVLVAGHALHGASDAPTVRMRRGERLLTDGPFADTEEHLIGYYVIDEPDLDAALGWAARMPSARTGAVEVRPAVPGSDAATMATTGESPSTS